MPALPILAYHRVLDVNNQQAYPNDIELVSASTSQFTGQVKWLSQNANPITFRKLGELLDAGKPIPKKSVIITFDDGFDDNYENAYRILKSFDVSATFFVSTGYIDHSETFWFDWVAHAVMTTDLASLELPHLGAYSNLDKGTDVRREVTKAILNGLKALTLDQQVAVLDKLELETGIPRSKTDIPDSRPLTSDQIREMAAGGMEFGSHGVSHRMLAKLSDEEIDFELRESKKILEELTGTDVVSVSYPTGGPRAFDKRVEEAASNLGYRFGCSYKRGMNRIGRLDQFALSRSAVERQVDPSWFACMIRLPGIF